MGKLFGSKGGLRIELDRGNYQTGDVVNGTVYLSVSDEVKTKGALVLDVNGEEYVKYNEVYGEVTVPRKQSNKLLADQLVLSDDRESFTPGEYVFPFNYQLRSTLPGSFHVDRRHAGEFCDIDAAVKYELKLRLPVKGAFKADIKAERPLLVKPAQTAQLVQPRTDAIAKHAKLLGMIRQGNCEVSGSLDRDVFVAGETLQVRASVVNGSSMDVKSVSVRLVESLVIHANSDHKEIKAQTCFAKKDFVGVKAGATTIDQAYSLDLGHLRLDLKRDKYQAGELVEGLIFITVEEEIRCSGVLEISGLETIAWTKRQGENSTHHRRIQSRFGDETGTHGGSRPDSTNHPSSGMLDK
ncbi:hypothetical protein JG688_00004435 [Phytophthora aleatoria]|uniref:Arrestin C-terminal-like domain-containing protein n=1 Tax=Phytophthora aleatoria TaxID=2496075 RepID=A0A8J5JAD3_9STRA|nr:hypothetical protein JG688_00004435 [Phytophthora aleatoria]